MSVQQVNLYTTEFRPVKDPLSLRNMLVALAMLWLAGAGYSGWLYWDLQQSQSQLSQLEHQHRLLEDQVTDYQSELAARAKDTFLHNENSRLRLQLGNTQGLLDAIAAGMDEGGHRIAFTNILVALSRHQLEPLWLRQISILSGGERVVLTGTTLQPEKVPYYLRALGQEGAFSGRSFNEFNLEMSAEEGDGQRQFTVDTQVEHEDGAEVDTSSVSNPSRIAPASAWPDDRFPYHRSPEDKGYSGSSVSLTYAVARNRTLSAATANAQELE